MALRGSDRYCSPVTQKTAQAAKLTALAAGLTHVVAADETSSAETVALPVAAGLPAAAAGHTNVVVFQGIGCSAEISTAAR